MLPDAERERIRLEESYRLEVRNQLNTDAPKRKGPGAWAVLNSSFGLWVLSAVFITGAGALFTQRQEAHASAAKRQETIERLDLEISYRISRVLGDLFSLAPATTTDSAQAGAEGDADVRIVLESLQRRPPKNSNFLYREFAEFELPALMAELRRHLPDDDERVAVDRALATVAGGIHLKEASVTGAANAIHRDVLLGRWKQEYFYYVDCPIETPMC